MVRHKMDHLACFIPAMLALGAHARAVRGDKAAEFLEVAEELGETCWQMYAQMPTGERPGARGWWFRGTVLRVETLDLEVAEELGETCWQMYAQMPTGERPRVWGRAG